jgi:hypothetical protein
LELERITPEREDKKQLRSDTNTPGIKTRACLTKSGRELMGLPDDLPPVVFFAAAARLSCASSSLQKLREADKIQQHRQQ